MRIALVVDVPDWAFHRIAKKIREYAPTGFEFSIFFIDYRNIKNFLKFEASNYDLVHFFWRTHVLSTPKDRNYKVSTSIYDHLYLDNLELTRKMLQRADYTYCSSNKLRDAYFHIFDTTLPVCEDGVDLVQFANPIQVQTRIGPLRLGWAGNSKAIGNDHKGYSSIVKPLISKLESARIEFEFTPADLS